MKHHLIISGTGRAGTTFLVRLFSACGLDTGFAADAPGDPISHAGLEYDVLSGSPLPYVVKSPHLCDTLRTWWNRGGIAIDRAIVPVRHLADAAASRRRVSTINPDPIQPGGVLRDLDGTQADMLALKFHRLMHTLALLEIPTTLLSFPRLAVDADYVWKSLVPYIDLGTWPEFLAAFQRVSRPELIHVF